MRTSSVLFVIFLLCTNSLPLNFRKLDSNHHKVIIDRIKVEFFNGEPSLEKLEELYAKVEKLLEEAKVQQTRHNQMYIENEKRCKKEHVEKQALIDTDTSAIETAELEKIECENTLKQIKSEYALPLTIASSIIILGIIIKEITPVIFYIQNLIDKMGIEGELTSTIIKVCLISYGNNFICNLCLDYGYKSIADKVDLATRFSLIALSIPWITKLYININKLL